MQVKAGNTSENLLHEIRQIIYSLHREKEVTQKVYDNIINSTKLLNRMDTIFMNSGNSKSSDPHRLLLNLSYKIDLKGGDKYVALSTWNEESELSDESCSVSDIQDYFEYIIKKYETVTDNPSKRIYVNKIKNKITFKIKTGYDLELLSPETMELLGSTKSKIINGENVPHLKTTEVLLRHCNIIKNDYHQESVVLHTFVPNTSLGQLLDILHKNLIFLKTFSSDFHIWKYGLLIKILNR